MEKMQKLDINTFLAHSSATAGALAAWWVDHYSGLIVGLAGLLIQAYFNHRRDRREQRQHDKQYEKDKKNI